MVTFYDIENCDTIKRARCRLEANNIDYYFHDHCVDGLDSELSNDFVNELGQEALLNTHGTAQRKLGGTTRDKIIDATFAAALMTEMSVIIKCPLLCVSGKPMLLGFSDSSYQQFFHEVQSISCPVIELAQQFIRRLSLSPSNAGRQALLIERLQTIGLTVERMDFTDIQNFQA